ncbi:MAG: hypothetical protein ACYSX0_16460 [Planctomycetota bacterium]
MRTVTLLLVTFSLAACSKPAGRIKTGDEGDLVGSSTAGSATYNQLIGNATRKLLDSVVAKQTGNELMKIAFIGIENRGAEELGDIREATNQAIENVIFKAKRFDMIAQRYVSHALKATGMRAEDLMLKGGREEFMGILREDGQTPDFMLWAIYTTLSTKGEFERQRDYLLTLELLDASSGRIVEKETERVRKAYR